ncbi:DUF4276 family protein [Azovibrio restrictus]|jgi:hypothetical protein|uniref:DUF4276 family protein n=1 Tax=Azovibrio restrictus TaxID=146938 RepID=UPI0026EEAC8F|nr:DUF4276 family protein [Azovibrio restrictus]
MNSLIAIVEGDGEVRALPALLRRIASRLGRYDVTIQTPIRVHRDKFLNDSHEFRRMLRLASTKARDGRVMVLLDADDDCPVTLMRKIKEGARSIIPVSQSLSVVIAQKEYEAWLLAAADSLAGQRGLPVDLVAPPNPESIRNAKGWLSERIANGRYHEVSDQAAFSATFDIDQALAASRSFRKFYKECEEALRSGSAGV